MPGSDMERVEAVPLQMEIFTATGVLGETFTFQGPAAYFPNGLLELSYLDEKTKRWIDFSPTKYTLDGGGVSVSFVSGFRVVAGTLIRAAYLSPESGGAVSSLSVIRDATDASKRANVDNIYDITLTPKGLYTIPMFVDPWDATNTEAKPLPWEGYYPNETKDQILVPWFKGGSANRGLGVGIHAARHEVLAATTTTVNIDPGDILVFSYMPIYKCRRVLGFLTHTAPTQAAGDPEAEVLIEQFDLQPINGTLVYPRLHYDTYRLDSFNQEGIWFDFDCHADWLSFAIINNTGDIISVRLWSLVGEVN